MSYYQASRKDRRKDQQWNNRVGKKKTGVKNSSTSYSGTMSPKSPIVKIVGFITIGALVITGVMFSIGSAMSVQTPANNQGTTFEEIPVEDIQFEEIPIEIENQ